MTVDEMIKRLSAFSECSLGDQNLVVVDNNGESRPIEKIVFNVPSGNFQIILKAKGWAV